MKRLLIVNKDLSCMRPILYVKLYHHIMLIIITILLSCCSSSGLIGKLPDVDLNKSAEIFIFNSSSRSNLTGAIILDDEPIITLEYRHYTIFRVPQGEHFIGLGCCIKYDIVHNYEAGKKYYYVIESGPINFALSPIIESKSKSWIRR